jgi:nicotinate phosphoribosyltransferase
LIATKDEVIDLQEKFRYVDPTKPWKNRYFEKCIAKPLQTQIFHNGECVYNEPTLEEIREFVKEQLRDEIWEEETRFENPHTHYMDMTPKMYEMKMNLLYEKHEVE